MPVKAKLVEERPAAPGEYKFWRRQGITQIAGMLFACPCGCGEVDSVRFDISPTVRQHKWNWNGDRNQPTLSPSLHKQEGCKWHGFLIDGVFKEVGE